MASGRSDCAGNVGTASLWVTGLRANDSVLARGCVSPVLVDASHHPDRPSLLTREPPRLGLRLGRRVDDVFAVRPVDVPAPKFRGCRSRYPGDVCRSYGNVDRRRATRRRETGPRDRRSPHLRVKRPARSAGEHQERTGPNRSAKACERVYTRACKTRNGSARMIRTNPSGRLHCDHRLG